MFFGIAFRNCSIRIAAENECGPIVHGLSNSAFGTLPGCNVMSILNNGATESGTTVTITTAVTGIANMVPDENGTVRPRKFGQLNVVSLFQFTANAEFNELGITNTNSLFGSVCHVVSFTTQANVTLKNTAGGLTGTVAPLSNVTFNPYSDYLLHDMGSGDSGGIPFQPAAPARPLL